MKQLTQSPTPLALNTKKNPNLLQKGISILRLEDLLLIT